MWLSSKTFLTLLWFCVLGWSWNIPLVPPLFFCAYFLCCGFSFVWWMAFRRCVLHEAMRHERGALLSLPCDHPYKHLIGVVGPWLGWVLARLIPSCGLLLGPVFSMSRLSVHTHLTTGLFRGCDMVVQLL